MATAQTNYERGKTSLAQSRGLALVKLVDFKEYSTSNSLVLALALLDNKHFQHPNINVNPAIVKTLALKLASVWNKESRYGYISNPTLEDNLAISDKTRRLATNTLRELGLFGVVEGYVNHRTKKSFTNRYYPLFDTKSMTVFKNDIERSYEVWQSNQPVIQPDEQPRLQDGNESTVPF